MNTVFAVSTSLGITLLLLVLVVYARKRLRIVRLLTFVLCLVAVAVGLTVYRASGVRLLPDFEELFVWLIATLAAITALRLVGLYVFDVYLKVQRNVRVPPLLPSLTLAVAYLIAALLVLRAVYPDLNLGPLLATSAVTSLVLGLALQPILGNFFAGVAISFEQPYRINDWVKIGSTEGRVVEITWRTTHLRTRDNDDLIIPNLKAADEYVLNYHYPNPLRLARINVGASYTDPPYRVKHALLECTTLVQGILEKPAPDVFVREFAESTIGYELRVWIEDTAAVERITSELRSRIWESFRSHGLSFPYPTRTIEIAPRRRDGASDAPSQAGTLYVADGASAGTSVRLTSGTIRIGRGLDNDVVVPDAFVSKDHARIECRPDGFVLVDLGSSGGTFVNGDAVTERRLERFDRIRVGNTVLCFERDAQ